MAFVLGVDRLDISSSYHLSSWAFVRIKETVATKGLWSRGQNWIPADAEVDGC